MPTDDDDARLAELFDRAARLMVTKQTARTMLRDVEERIQTVKQEIIAAGGVVGHAMNTKHGLLRLDEGPVTGRRSVDRDYLVANYESLPKPVRDILDDPGVATVGLSRLDPAVRQAVVDADGVKVSPRAVTVADAESMLPRGMRAMAVTEQQRGPAVLVLDDGGISVADNE